MRLRVTGEIILRLACRLSGLGFRKSLSWKDEREAGNLMETAHALELGKIALDQSLVKDVLKSEYLLSDSIGCFSFLHSLVREKTAKNEFFSFGSSSIAVVLTP